MSQISELVHELYKDEEGLPFSLCTGQEEIFSALFKRLYSRVFITAYTQYGKSDTIALAILTRVCAFPEKYAIVAPTEEKARIIMGYTIGHIFDNPLTLAKFQIDKSEHIDRIRRERNKSHLTFRHSQGIGEILTYSAEGRKTKDVIRTLLGFGSKNVVLDESPTLSEEHYAGVLRMLGGHKDNMLVELGNAINRGHFYFTSRDPTYHHIKIDYRQGIAEGRQTEEFFDEMRRKMRPDLFKMLYECEFPEEDSVDEEGYVSLFTTKDIDTAFVDHIEGFGEPAIGVDVAGGGRNYSVIVIRSFNAAQIIYRKQNPDTMSFVGEILRMADQYQVMPSNIFVDVVGIGKGVYDRLREQGLGIMGINVGVRAEEGEQFMNLRAFAYWKMYEWLRSGGKLKKDSAWEELLRIRWKTESGKKIRIMSKEDMLRRGLESPDVADALALTFSRPRRQLSRPMNSEEVANLVKSTLS